MLDPHPKRVNVGGAGDVLQTVVAIILVLNEPSTPPDRGRHGSSRHRQASMGLAPLGSPVVAGSGRRPVRHRGDDGTRTHDPLLAKPDRGRSLPGRMTDGAGRGHRGLVRGCPLRTDRDCCEWHGSGTSDEDDVRAAGSVGISSTVAQGPSPADVCLVGKPPFGGAAALDSIRSLAR
jgi:hypothetical protein